MSERAPPPAFERLYREYPEGTKAEIAGREIRVLPGPRPRHVRVTTRLGRLLGNAFDHDASGPGGWVLLVEPEARFGDDVRAPDLCGWRLERYDELDDGPFVVIPDWVCEVLSPTTARYDRGEEMPLFAERGVGHLWIVDPTAETLEVYVPEGDPWVVFGAFGATDVVSAPPFASHPLDLSLGFRKPG